ncbi:MAG: hypothetical protein IT210_04675 [Armatimonadetes bacterium]|nr:hypothetical protein [Armatimonadota bacterium]
MNDTISRDIEDEAPEAKARWFRSLTLEERMDYLCQITDMILEINPSILKAKDAEPIEGRVLILRLDTDRKG